ncbi:M91 family zinc metallopeptidase [Methylobacterium trifolii]|uniref:DUF4157 domain-containing protein n=1 Tax=Methylobacterium trifolii TaxID=1003092 RepID=A0ABQ4U2R2_9HYPH|nr:M91 family zinc metallopeptidase [Methylobacterium trifolii]GJE61750.1 hypothetical protein MPOCJGCO_3875 [Methylobacterium trifolii]
MSTDDDWKALVAADIRKALPSATAEQVLVSRGTAYGNSVKINTPWFPTWLKKNDPHRRRSLTASVADFQQRRQEFHDIIADLLSQIALYDIGNALFHELDATPNIVTIWPYGLYHDDANATAGVTHKDRPAATRPGFPIDPGMRSSILGTGAGADAMVHISPNQWDRSGPSGPGSRPDEILFHELVHASRQMRGRAYGMPVNAGYDNEEEYISVVLSNIYLSHKRQTVFRANHHGFHPLPQPERFLDNVQKVNLPPEELIERLRHTTLPFYYAIMRIPDETAWFNPVRDYERARFQALSWDPNAA